MAVACLGAICLRIRPARRGAQVRVARAFNLLGTLFDRLIVRDGQIVEYVPRRDRIAEVIALVERAIPKGVVTAPQTEYGWRAKGRPRTVTAIGGKGGIRTLEGVSHPLPA